MNNPTRLVDDPFLGKDVVVGTYDNKQLRQFYNSLKTAKGYNVWANCQDTHFSIERSYSPEDCKQLRKFLCRFLKRVKLELAFHDGGIQIW